MTDKYIELTIDANGSIEMKAIGFNEPAVDEVLKELRRIIVKAKKARACKSEDI